MEENRMHTMDTGLQKLIVLNDELTSKVEKLKEISLYTSVSVKSDIGLKSITMIEELKSFIAEDQRIPILAHNFRNLKNQLERLRNLTRDKLNTVEQDWINFST